MRMDTRASVTSSAASEHILADSRTPLPPGALDATSVMAVAGEAALAATLDVVSVSPAVVALSQNHGLLQAVTQAVIERVAVVTCPSADRFVDQLVANGADLAIIDAEFAPEPLDVFLLALRRQFPQLQLILVGPPPLREQLSAQIANGTVFRFAPAPASAERLRTLLYAAVRQRDAALAELAGLGEAPHSSKHSPVSKPRQPRPAWIWPALLAVTAMTAAAAGWLASAWADHHLPF
jgi:hypothetical protein